MEKLKLGPLIEDKPIKLTIELPADVHRALTAYAEVLANQTGQIIAEPSRLIAPMIQHFIASDRGFAKAKKAQRQK